MPVGPLLRHISSLCVFIVVLRSSAILLFRRENFPPDVLWPRASEADSPNLEFVVKSREALLQWVAER